MRPSGLERPQEIPIEEKPAIVPEAPSVPERPVVMPSVEPMAARPATYPRRPVMPPQPIRPKAEIPHLQVPMPSLEREPAGFTPLRFRNLEEESAPIFVKIAAIFLIMLFLAGIGSFTYWFFFIKERPQPPVCAQVITPAINPKTGECKDFATPCAVPKEWEPVDACEGPLPPPPPPPIVEPEPPQSLIPEANLAETKTIAITSKDELAPALAKAVEENYTSGKFTRILIKPDETTLHDVGEAYITLQHFFDFMGISIPENVLSKLNQEYTLFARPQKEGNRLGLAVKIKTKSGLWEAMKAWEPKMISDWDSLFRIWVVYKQAPEYSPKEVSWQGVPLRYIAYMPGLGINYAISGDYLFFTTSGDSIHALIESLK